MSALLHKKSILKKTFEVGSSTLLSRFFGLLREVLMVRYLGSGAMSDAFFTAFKVPNSLRKIFAEGALSAAFIPTLVTVVRKDKEQASKLITLGFIIFEGLLLVACAVVMWKAELVLNLIVPGFSQAQIQNTIPLLRILMPFILFVSSGALLAGALQSVGHFFVPAFAPVLLNIVFIISLLLCLYFSLPINIFCVLVLFGGFLQFLVHLIMYLKLHFTFSLFDAQTCRQFKSVLLKFFPCLITMSVMELSLFIDTSFASYLPAGSISLLNYASRFMGIPLGVFAVAFSTILLPHFSRVTTYAPKRMSFYLLETTKFVFWVTIPATLMLSFLSEKIFHTIFLSEKFSLAQVEQASMILIAFVIGLFFFSLNKILLNIYYALHVTWIPTLISLVATLANILGNYLLMTRYHATGLALATTFTVGALQTLLLLYFLVSFFKFRLYVADFATFFIRYTCQLSIVFAVTYGIYRIFEWAMLQLPSWLMPTMVYGLGFWLWAGPLCGLVMLTILVTRKLFKVQLYFLN